MLDSIIASDILYNHHAYSVAKSCPTLVTPWTIAHQAPLSMRFSRQQCWSGLPFSSGFWRNDWFYEWSRNYTRWGCNLLDCHTLRKFKIKQKNCLCTWKNHGSHQLKEFSMQKRKQIEPSNSWGHKESDTTEWLKWTELNWDIALENPRVNYGCPPKKPGNIVIELEREVVSQLHGIDRSKSWIVRE